MLETKKRGDREENGGRRIEKKGRGHKLVRYDERIIEKEEKEKKIRVNDLE